MAASCTRSSRLVRGGIGALVGGVAGGIVGFGVSLVLMRNMMTSASEGGLAVFDNMAAFAFGPPGLGLVGAVTGATIGAWKPQC